MNTKVNRISTISYFGGKSKQLDWLLPLIDIPHANYVEPFAGSAAVFLNKKPSQIETLNDIDGRLMNFFKVLRSEPEKLIEQISLTLYSRNEFQNALQSDNNSIEDARRFFVRCMQSFAGICDESRRVNSWRISVSESRRGKSLEVSKWLMKIDKLKFLVDRLKCAQIENRDFRHIIPQFDAKSTLFYCDPPYLHGTRSGKSDYKYEMNDEDHGELAELLNNALGKVALSSYDCKQLDKLYSKRKWIKNYGPERNTNLGKAKGKREIVLTNYKPSNYKTLFN